MSEDDDVACDPVGDRTRDDPHTVDDPHTADDPLTADDPHTVADDQIADGNADHSRDAVGVPDGGAQMTPSADGPTFQDLAWEETAGSGILSGIVITRRTVALLATLGTLTAVLLYDVFVVPTAHSLVFAFSPTVIDWLGIYSTTLLVFYVVVPLFEHRRATGRYLRRLRQRPAAVASLGFLSVLAVVGIVGPPVYGPPSHAPLWAELQVRGTAASLPPFWTGVDASHLVNCPTTVVEGKCQGDIVHPLGTTIVGDDVLGYVIAGARVAIEVTVITAALLVPIATIVGTVSAYAGGWVDTVLMRYADIQGAIPAFLAYLLYQYLYGGSVVVLILLFGLLDWDRIARRVRDDARRKRDAGYVVAAESAGARPVDVIRRHLVPNVTTTVVAGLATQIPFVLVMEATFSFLGVVDSDLPSWGRAIAIGFESGFMWWAYLFPTLALVATAVALNVLGTALVDVLRPRSVEEE